MIVKCECLANPKSLHRHKANAIDEAQGAPVCRLEKGDTCDVQRLVNPLHVEYWHQIRMKPSACL